MRAWPIVACLLLLAGCRTDPNIVLLERENRQLEDRIYQLEDLVQQTQTALDSCQRGAASCGRDPLGLTAPQRTIGPALVDPSPPAMPAPARGRSPVPPAEIRPPAVELPPSGLPGRAAGAIPDEPKQPPASVSPGTPSPGTSSPGTAPPANGMPRNQRAGAIHNASVRAATPQGHGGAVQQVTLHRLLTGGYNADGQPGHEGIQLVIEPRDQQGRLLQAAAPVSVVVLDPAETGESARVARWDFTAEEVAARWRSSPLAQGFLLQMVWPVRPPGHAQLRLVVRYGDEVRGLQVQRDVELQLPGPGSMTAGSAPQELPSLGSAGTGVWRASPMPISPAPTRLPPVTSAPSIVVKEADSPAPEDLPEIAPAQTARRDSAASPPATAPAGDTMPQRPAWTPYRR